MNVSFGTRTAAPLIAAALKAAVEGLLAECITAQAENNCPEAYRIRDRGLRPLK